MKGINKISFRPYIRNTKLAIKLNKKGNYIDYVREKLDEEFMPLEIDVINKVKLDFENKIIASQDTNNLISYVSCATAVIAIMFYFYPLEKDIYSNIVVSTCLLLLFILVTYAFVTKTHLRSCNTIVTILNNIIHKKKNELLLTNELEKAEKETERLKYITTKQAFAHELEKRRNRRWKPLD